jgi:hypothetical protein
LLVGLVAVGLLQAVVALVLLARCAATRRRRRRAEQDIAEGRFVTGADLRSRYFAR